MHLPSPTAPSLKHLSLAREAVSCGAMPRAIQHLDRALTDGLIEDLGPDGVRAEYRTLLKNGRSRCGSDAVELLLEHLVESAALPPDAAFAHLAATDAAYRGQLERGVRLLSACSAAGGSLSVGSFDALIQAASRSGSSAGAVRAYRAMRRHGLRPTAMTLNALLKERCSRRSADATAQAEALLRRAEAGAPRWPGEPPDLCSWTTVIGALSRRASRSDGRGRGSRSGRRSADEADMDADTNADADALFEELCRHPRLRPDAQAYNVAIKGRLARGDGQGALALFRRMRRGAGGAPPPRIDTYNTLLGGLRRAGEAGALPWLLRELEASAEFGVTPDEYTCCTLLREARDMRGSRRAWEWSRRRGAGVSGRAWHHLAEAHLRHGKPARVAAVLGLARRSGIRLGAASHNLHMRALLSRGDADAALRHFERMSAAANAAEDASADFDADADADADADGPSSAAEDAADAACSDAEGAGSAAEWEAAAAAWLGPPPRPDAYTYAIALTALGKSPSSPSSSPPSSSSRSSPRSTERALELARAAASAPARGRGRAARGRGSESAAPSERRLMSAPVVHALLSSCGADVPAALALWRSEVLPQLRQAASASASASGGGGGGGGKAAGAEARAVEEAQQAGLHALMRVCGSAGRADEALRLVVALRKQGGTPRGTHWSAFENARDASTSSLFQRGYERLLALECCPERAMEGMPTLGDIERIRIRW